MPPLETMGRLEDAVLWVKTGDDKQGEPVVDAPVAIKITANFGLRNTMQSDGSVKSSDVQVVVDRDVPIDSIIWFGKLRDKPASTETALYYSVVDSKRSPDLKHRAVNTFYGVSLKRFRGRLPDIRSAS